MKILNYLTIILFLFLVVEPSALPHSLATTTAPKSVGESFSNSHLIEGVPYIYQTEGYFCYYTSCAMIFQYLGLNTSLEEILFYDGVGYATYYQSEERLPREGRYLGDFTFVLELFGLEIERWISTNDTRDSYDQWDIYYEKVKENISQDIPVITLVDPFSLPSLRDQFILPDILWNMMLTPSIHVIVIIGYDDENQSVCYCDPNAGFYGDSSFGDHAWMSVETYKESVEQNRVGRYMISIVNQLHDPLPKEEAFEHAYLLNIERLKGNQSAYDHILEWGNGLFGINASKQLQIDYSQGENNREITRELYKTQGDTGIYYTVVSSLALLSSVLSPQKPSIFDMYMVGELDPFEGIAREKNHIKTYLEQSKFYQEMCVKQASLLREEIDEWNTLSKYYKVFMKRGNYLSLYRADYLVEKMEETIQSIITIEQEIIDTILE